MAPSADVFVSYSREDAARVSDLVTKLRVAGVSLWIDQGGIDAASQWSEQIVNALESAKALLLMVSDSSVHSHNVAKEVVLVSERKGHILPVHLQPTAIPPALKYQLAGIQHVEYFTDSDNALKTILRALERLGVKLAPPPTLTLPATNLTQATRQGTAPKSFQKASLICGMPLPAASGQKTFNRTPTTSDDTTTMAKLPKANVVMDCLDRAVSPS